MKGFIARPSSCFKLTGKAIPSVLILSLLLLLEICEVPVACKELGGQAEVGFGKEDAEFPSIMDD